MPSAPVYTVEGADCLHVLEQCPALQRAEAVEAHPAEEEEDLDALSERFGLPICGTCLRMMNAEDEPLYHAESMIQALEVWPDLICFVTKRGLFNGERLLEVPISQLISCSAQGPGLLAPARIIMPYRRGRLFPEDEATGPGTIDFPFGDRDDRDEAVELIQRLLVRPGQPEDAEPAFRASSVRDGPSLAEAVPVPLTSLRMDPVSAAGLDKQNIRRCTPPSGDGKPPLPKEFSLRSRMTPAKDQNPHPSCVSFAITGMLEYIHGRLLSEACLMDATEFLQEDGKAAENSTADVLRAAREIGTCDEALWRYDRARIWNPEKRREVAGSPFYRLSKACYLFCDERATILSRMRNIRAKFRGEGEPGNYGINPHDQRATLLKQHLWWRQTPLLVSFALIEGAIVGNRILMPQSLNPIERYAEAFEPGKEAWHGVLLTGYNDRTKTFDFKNSWGHDWQGDGYGTVAYDYIKLFADLAIAGPPRQRSTS